METLIQQFKTLPYPEQDRTGRTIVVTGANTGLGLEAARHLVRLNAAKVILACRNADKGAAVNPGLCSTELFRRLYFPVNIIFGVVLAVIARSSEMGSRTLMAGAFAGEETHGQFMSHCRMEVWPGVMDGEHGKVLSDKVGGELLDIMEGIEAGVTTNL